MGTENPRECTFLEKGGLGTSPSKPYHCRKGLKVNILNGLPVAPDWCQDSFPDKAGKHFCVDSGDDLDRVALTDESVIIFCEDDSLPWE